MWVSVLEDWHLSSEWKQHDYDFGNWYCNVLCTFYVKGRIAHVGQPSNVWFALDENCWVCKKWLLHSSFAGLTSPPFLIQDQNGEVTVECSIHFLHTQQFLSSANRTLTVTSEKGGREINGIWCAIFLLRKQVISQRGLCSLAIMSHGRPLPGNSGHFCSEMDIVGANC